MTFRTGSPATPRPEYSDDYDRLMRANLHRVFGERDTVRRLEAIREIYIPDATLYEPDALATGYDAISNAVGALLDGLPAEFEFTVLAPAVGHHGVARLRWRGGPPNGPVMVTGTDVVELQERRIRSLYVFIDPASS